MNDYMLAGAYIMGAALIVTAIVAWGRRQVRVLDLLLEENRRTNDRDSFLAAVSWDTRDDYGHDDETPIYAEVVEQIARRASEGIDAEWARIEANGWSA